MKDKNYDSYTSLVSIQSRIPFCRSSVLLRLEFKNQITSCFKIMHKSPNCAIIEAL